MSRRSERRQQDRRYRETVWHHAGDTPQRQPRGGQKPGPRSRDDQPSGRRPLAGGVARSHRAAAEAAQHSKRTILRGSIISVLIVLVVLIITVVWPQISLLMSPAKPVVDRLYTSSVYAGPGTGSVDTKELSGIIGTRPIAVVILGEDDALGDDALATCEAVTDQLSQLIVQVIVDGEFENGCEGDDVAYASGVKWESWDFGFWLQQSYSTSLADDDLPELTRQLALAYDAEVKGGRILPTEREFQSPPNRAVIAAGITAAVVGGTVALFVVLRLVTRWGFAAADRRLDWDRRRDEIDGELGDIALTMIGTRPGELADRSLAAAIGEVADDYRAALDALAAAEPGDDLEALGRAVRAIRDRIDTAAARA